ncbi:hypothetical protein HBI70_233620 [Parastagonospora nodorum]|nr:hypothetical protein HBI70_233620 [Parastagonospora nodorum]KAH6139770.1 hypothetical protein HBI68_220480 [Parastagonospora nodorum]
MTYSLASSKSLQKTGLSRPRGATSSIPTRTSVGPVLEFRLPFSFINFALQSFFLSVCSVKSFNLHVPDPIFQNFFPDFIFQSFHSLFPLADDSLEFANLHVFAFADPLHALELTVSCSPVP